MKKLLAIATTVLFCSVGYTDVPLILQDVCKNAAHPDLCSSKINQICQDQVNCDALAKAVQNCIQNNMNNEELKKGCIKQAITG